MLNKKENISLKTFQNSTKSKKETVLDNDLINAIDIPFIVLKDNNSIDFINNAAKTKFRLTKESNIFHTFRRPEFKDNILKFRLKNTRKLDRKALNLLRNQEIQAIIN